MNRLAYPEKRIPGRIPKAEAVPERTRKYTKASCGNVKNTTCAASTWEAFSRPWITGPHSIRQRVGLRGSGGARMVGTTGREDAVHRTRPTMGELILREIQWQAEGRMPLPGTLLHTARSADPHRTPAELLQHRTPTQCAWLSPASAQDNVAFTRSQGLRFSTCPQIEGPCPCRVQTLELDYPGDTGQ